MICFDLENSRFHLRAAGIARHPDGERVLVTTEPHLGFSYLPGGRVEMNETAQEALVREMREELGVAARIERLLFVAEIFFTLGGRNYHEVGLYFEIAFPDDPDIYERATPWAGIETTMDLLFWWQRVQGGDADPARPLLPLFLRETLSRPLPDTPMHLVHRETREML